MMAGSILPRNIGLGIEFMIPEEIQEILAEHKLRVSHKRLG